MKILIITMEDPLFTVDFFKAIIREKYKNIIGITIARGNRLSISSKRSKIEYLLSLFLIMGISSFIKFSFKVFWYKFRTKLITHNSPSLEQFAKRYSIPVDYTDNPNDSKYLEKIRKKAPDIIINQSQFIIKKKLLSLPKIGMINRHNALLPKNRGRLTPFWVLYRKEQETGVSIHFVDEGVDSGPIIVQKRFMVEENESFYSLVKKNYYWAQKAILEALDKIAAGKTEYIDNPDSKTTYNTIPTLSQAWEFRRRRLWRMVTD